MIQSVKCRYYIGMWRQINPPLNIFFVWYCFQQQIILEIITVHKKRPLTYNFLDLHEN